MQSAGFQSLYLASTTIATRLSSKALLVMYELISNPGLRFELFDLRGLLTYTFERDGKPAKQYILSTADFEDASGDEDDTEKPPPKKPGAEISAVGTRLRLLKNEGLLRMVFEGEEGASADWSFEGLGFVAGKPMLASASTQTHTDPDKCSTCGRGADVLKVVQDHGIQTDTKALQESGSQTDVKAGVQPKAEPGSGTSHARSMST